MGLSQLNGGWACREVCFFPISYSLPQSLRAPLPPVKPVLSLWQRGRNLHANVFLTLKHLHKGDCWCKLPDIFSPTPPPPPPPLENSFLSAACLSPTMHEAKDGARRSEFPLKLPASSAGNNSVASTAAAAAAASVRETLRDAERGSVCESQCV